MPHPISTLGAIHTVISLVPVVAGAYNVLRFKRFEPATPSGIVYFVGLTLSVFTSFGLSSTGGFNPGHALGILALLAAFSGLLIPRVAFLGRARPYLAMLAISFSYFLLNVPAINETLTRLPAGHPLADSPQSPVVLGSLAAWLLIFLTACILQSRVIIRARQH